MTREQMLLTILAEECNEVAHRASKAIRFGMDEVQEGQSLNNAERILYEFYDLMAVMELLVDGGSLPHLFDRFASDLKKVKVEKYLEYSKECGTLDV